MKKEEKPKNNHIENTDPIQPDIPQIPLKIDEQMPEPSSLI